MDLYAAIALAILLGVIALNALRDTNEKQKIEKSIRNGKAARQASLLEALKQFDEHRYEFRTQDKTPLEFEAHEDAQKGTPRRYAFRVSESQNPARYWSLNKPVPEEHAKFVRKALTGIVERLGKNLVPISDEAKKSRDTLQRKIEAEGVRRRDERKEDISKRARRDAGPKATSVYLMEGNKHVKVGISADPDKRLKQIQTGNPNRIKLVARWWFFSKRDARKVEQLAHTLLKMRDVHTNGEWFQISVYRAKNVVETAALDLIATNSLQDEPMLQGALSPPGLDGQLASLGSSGWYSSRNGNPTLVKDGIRCTVFKRDGRWAYKVGSQFSTEPYPSQQAAKIGAMIELKRALFLPTKPS